jgi:hypothetical protein
MATVKTTRWALLLAFLGTAATGAEVYRSTDANGVQTFSDRPNGNSEAIYVATPRPGRPGNTVAARPAPAQANPAAATAEAAPAAPPARPPPAEATPAERAERAAIREKNCGIARARSEKFQVSHRLYREEANGERVYLTAAEMDEAKARAAADVATWCD